MNNSAILEFQSFDLDSPTHSESRIDVKHEKTERESPDPSEQESSRYSNKSFWTFEYYQQFFDVNTDEVKERILWSMVPRSRKNFLEHYIRPNPDLYGPVWICTTLIFTMAVSGNVANYLQYAPQGNYRWRYDFHLISIAATAIFAYACLVPVALYTFIKWNSTEVPLSFLELLCAYGYSVSIYVPVSILAVIQVPWFQWGIVLAAATLSAAVLVTSITHSVQGTKKVGVVTLVVSFHFLLAVGLLLYFLHAPQPPIPPSLPQPSPSVVADAVAAALKSNTTAAHSVVSH